MSGDLSAKKFPHNKIVTVLYSEQEVIKGISEEKSPTLRIAYFI